MSAENVARTAAEHCVDFHCHIASAEFFPRSFVDGAVENMAVHFLNRGIPAKREKIAALFLAKMQDANCDELVAQMDEAGIQRSVLLLADFTYALRDTPLTIEEMVQRHRAVMLRHPGRLCAFAGIDPRWGTDGLALFERCAGEYGFHGLKVYPPCGFSPSSALLYPYYEICAQLHLPVLVHIGATSPILDFELARPIHIDKAARDFPGVNFILAHGSVHYPDECAMLCSHRPNVYLDVSGFEIAELARLHAVFLRRINHKVLFGTDWPFFRMQGTQRDFVDRLTQNDGVFPPNMPSADIRSFFSGNADLLLRPRLRSLGDERLTASSN
jgi:uncharacterized protein